VYELLGRKLDANDEFRLDFRKLGLHVELSDDDKSDEGA
jgi:hypothetical protein